MYCRATVWGGMQGRPRFFYGWVVVATAALGMFFSAAPIIVYSCSIFLKPLAESFHVGRGAISLAFTIHNSIAALCAPIVGRLVDRFGAKRVILPGLALLALILMSALLIESHLWQLYFFYVALAPITVATTPVPYSAVISRWFDRRRGLALGLAMFGLGMGTVFFPPVMQRLISSLGWRAAFACAGAAILVVPMGFVVVFLAEDPKRRGLQMDGVHQTAAAAERQAPGMMWPEIWRTRTFWLLIAAFFLAGASVHACVLHIGALLNDRGLSLQSAAVGTSIVGVAVVVGRLLSGYLQDWVFGPYVACGIFAASALGMALLAIGAGGVLAPAAAFLAGLGMGAETDIIAFLMSRYFGLRALGTSFGFAFGSFVLAGGLGGWLMGVGFDRTASYRMPLVGFFTATVVAIALFTRLGPYRFEAARESEIVAVAEGGAA